MNRHCFHGFASTNYVEMQNIIISKVQDGLNSFEFTQLEWIYPLQDGWEGKCKANSISFNGSKVLCVYMCATTCICCLEIHVLIIKQLPW